MNATISAPASRVAAPAATHEVLIDGANFWPALARDIANARESILIQTLTFEGDAAGNALADALIASSAPSRSVLVDSFNLYFQSDRFVYAPWNLGAGSPVRAEAAATRSMIERLRAAGVDVRYTNPAGAFLRRFLARDHKKMAVIDDAIAYIGGINFCDHNFEWHDMMVRIERPEVARAMASDFHATSDGILAPTATRCGDMEVLNLDGARNELVCRRILRSIDDAQATVYVLSPYMTFPFTDALRRAVQRGVRVVVVVPALNNRGLLTAYMRGEAARSGFELQLYNGMTHLKGMLIDDRELVFGSSNFDWLSYHLIAEVVTLTTNRDVIEQFRERVLLPDLADCTLSPTGTPWHANVLDLAFRAVSRIARFICKPKLRPVAPHAVPMTRNTSEAPMKYRRRLELHVEAK